MHTGMYGHHSWWNGGIFSLPAEVTVFLIMNSILKELYCISETPLYVLKI